MDLSGKTTLITGASRGIGEATAREFAAAGSNVVLMARSRDAIDKLQTEIGDKARAVACDVGDFGQVQNAVSVAVDTFGTVDIVVNNAGVIEPISEIAGSDPEEWARAITINLTGVYHVIRAVLPVMHQRGNGTVLNISSGAAHGPMHAWSHYCASKAGAAMLTRCLDKEERGNGIRTMGLSPGTVATQMQREIKASRLNPVSKLDWSDHIPPEWVARTLLWMCGPDADAFVGEEIGLRDPEIRRRVGLTE